MCSAKMYPLEALMMDCREYFQQTGRRVTLEYTLMAGVNDGLEQVHSPPQDFHSHLKHLTGRLYFSKFVSATEFSAQPWPM